MNDNIAIKYTFVNHFLSMYTGKKSQLSQQNGFIAASATATYV